MQEYLPILKKSQLFMRLTDEEILNAVSCLCGKVKTYQKSSTVFCEGETSELCAIVLSGEIVLKKNDFNGSQNIIARMFPSQILAAASVFSSNGHHPFDAEAVVESQVLPFNKNSLLRPCQNACRFHSTIIENLLTVISDNNVILAEKIDVLTKRTTREKILTFLYSQSKKSKSQTTSFAINLNRNQMAQFLSVDRSSLSRELSKMQSEGLIQFDGNHFRLNI